MPKPTFAQLLEIRARVAAGARPSLVAGALGVALSLVTWACQGVDVRTRKMRSATRPVLPPRALQPPLARPAARPAA